MVIAVCDRYSAPFTELSTLNSCKVPIEGRFACAIISSEPTYVTLPPPPCPGLLVLIPFTVQLLEPVYGAPPMSGLEFPKGIATDIPGTKLMM